MTQPDEVDAAVLAFLCTRPRFAQLVTVDAHGAPVTRTVGAEVGADWTVELVARRGHARLRHLAANPWLQLLFVGESATSDPVENPAVIDYGLPIPRVVALTGWAEPLDDAPTVAAYRRQTAAARRRGDIRAPQRTDDEVRAELAGMRVHVTRIRAEGFADGAKAITWTPPGAVLVPSVRDVRRREPA